MRKVLGSILALAIIAYIGNFILGELRIEESENMDEGSSFNVMLEDLKLKGEYDYTFIDDQIYFSAEFIKNYIDKDIFHDEEESVLIKTTQKSVYRFWPNELTGTVNNKEIQLITPLEKKDDMIYVPHDLLRELYRDTVDFKWLDNSLVMDYRGYEYLVGTLSSDSQVFLSPHRRAPSIGNKLISGEKVVIFAQEDDWFRVRTIQGRVGYIHQDNLLVEYGKNRFKRENQKDDSSTGSDTLINLTWDYTYGPMRDVDSAAQLPGVNVISPTWFDILDSEGNIYDKGNSNYSSFYRQDGIKVWPAVTNSFDPEMTKELLRSSSKRQRIIVELVAIYEYYNVDGINIDFENIHYEEKDYLTQFLRELYPVFKEKGMTVSMDVTARSDSPYWSMVYDRERLHNSLDYIILMAYDQHWAASPVAGSVAEYWWVENSISRILEQVPEEKLVLGMPFYSRVWDVDSSGVSSQAVTMGTAMDFIEKNLIDLVWDEKSMQYYGEIEIGDTIRKIWLEDEKSMYYKTSLVHKYGLAGIATWRKGFEIPSVWESLEINLN